MLEDEAQPAPGERPAHYQVLSPPAWQAAHPLSAPLEHTASRTNVGTNKVVSVLGAQFKYGTSRAVTVPSIPDPPQPVGCDQCSARAAKLSHARRALKIAAAERDVARKTLAAERLENEEAAVESATELLRVSELLSAHVSQSHANVARQAAGRRAIEASMEARAVQ
jgi:hypothetical protein